GAGRRRRRARASTGRGGWLGRSPTSRAPRPWPSVTSWRRWATALPTSPPERPRSGSRRPVGGALAGDLVHLFRGEQDDGLDLGDAGGGHGHAGGRGRVVVGRVEDGVEVVLSERVVEEVQLGSRALGQALDDGSAGGPAFLQRSPDAVNGERGPNQILGHGLSPPVSKKLGSCGNRGLGRQQDRRRS